MTVDIASLVMRIALAAIFCVQGFVKCFAAPDAPHGRLASQNLIRTAGWPYPTALAWLLGLTELVFGALTGIGVAVRIVTIPLMAVLALAITVFKRKAGFIGGWDWPLAVLTLVVSVALIGGQRFSIDAVLGWSL